MYKFSAVSLSRLQTVDTRLQHIFEEAITHSPIDFGIPPYGGKRTTEEQKGLYDKGASRADGTVNKSYHQTGLAVDVFAYVNGRASWDEKHLTLIAGHILGTAKRLGYNNLEWGGNWLGFIDMPHYQLPD